MYRKQSYPSRWRPTHKIDDASFRLLTPSCGNTVGYVTSPHSFSFSSINSSFFPRAKRNLLVGLMGRTIVPERKSRSCSTRHSPKKETTAASKNRLPDSLRHLLFPVNLRASSSRGPFHLLPPDTFSTGSSLVRIFSPQQISLGGEVLYGKPENEEQSQRLV